MKHKLVYLNLAIIIVIVGVIYFNYSTLYDAWYYATKPALPQAISYLGQKLDRVEDLTTLESMASSSEAIEHNLKIAPTVPPIEKLSRPLAPELNLNVPFEPQAPFGNWAEPYQDACEEASMIMVDHYLRGVGLSQQEMKDEIDQRIAWETKNWGYQKNLSIEKVQAVARVFYKHQTEIITDLTIAKIKLELNLGRPVIVPLAARLIYNPNFISPGPLYHVIVIRGYTANGLFITNDPGTHLGADYLYNENTIISAIHDWDGANPAGASLGLIMFD